MNNTIYFKRYIIAAIVIMVTSIAFAGLGCFGSEEKQTPITSGLTVPAISEVTPKDGSSIAKTDKIIVKFITSPYTHIDSGTLVLEGTMSGESDGGVWSTTAVESDTLTISPKTAWTIGTGTLTVTCKDSEGNTISTSSTEDEASSGSLTYGVQVFYVKSGKSGDGSVYNESGDINAAVTKAAAKLKNGTWVPPAQVHVAKGTYEVTAGSSHVVMSEGVSLYGGYSDTDWAMRDPVTNTTIIKEISQTGGTGEQPNPAVEAGSAITAATVIDGFKIIGGGGDVSSCVFNHDGSALTIANNTIEAGSAALNQGIYNLNGSSPTIYGNSIKGGSGANGSFAIYNYANSLPKIYNNIINGGEGNVAFGIYNYFKCAPTIYNNTIDGGSGAISTGIWNESESTPAIANNIISAPASTSGFGIREANVNCSPTELRNNDIFNCKTTLYFDEGSTAINAIAGVNALTGANANVSEDPKFGDSLHLTSTSPDAVKQGGLDGAAPAQNWGFTTDKDGKTRTGNGTTGWSMGAYEFSDQ
ncbi:MAG: right-handed parallel beta-helix repeat-containing protein [Pseudomonadota bacterium]